MPKYVKMPDGSMREIPEVVSQDFSDEEQPEEGQGSKWQWIGSPDRPESEKHSDGISDLFEVDNEDDTQDLVSVDIEHDIIDTNEQGNLDDLTEVSEEDIMGDEDTGQIPLEHTADDEKMLREFNQPYTVPKSSEPSRRSVRRYRLTPGTRLGGMR